MCSMNQQSETQESYAPPRIRPIEKTREQCLEEFLWKEFYNEYLNARSNENAPKEEKANTEYFDEFCKDVPEENKEAKEKLIARYPVYCTTAITLWNNNGDPTKDFKKRYLITRPVQEQYEQWG